jgi:methionine synthase II (cobalamin-independent)
MLPVTKQTTIEDLVAQVPEAVDYLFKKGIRCIRCGEPLWGTLEQVAKEKGFSDDEIDLVVEELNSLKPL